MRGRDGARMGVRETRQWRQEVGDESLRGLPPSAAQSAWVIPASTPGGEEGGREALPLSKVTREASRMRGRRRGGCERRHRE